MTPARPLRVLLVEDSAADAELLSRQLERNGWQPTLHRVETAEAMDKALAEHPWDLVISDYILPRFSAPAALKVLQGRKVDIPFIIISGAVGEETAVAAMKAGAADYVRKDNPARLGPAIQRELRDARERRQRRQAEETLREVETRFRQMVDAITDVFWVSAADGRKVIYVNRAYETVWGRPCRSLLDQPNSWLEAVHPDDRAAVQSAHETAGQAHHSRERAVEYRVLRPDGSIRWIRARVVDILDAGRKVERRCVIAQDVTERKRLEREVLAAGVNEQRRIGQDLHDSLGQDLTGIAFLVKLLQNRLAEKELPEAAAAAEIGEHVNKAIGQTRSLARGLCPLGSGGDGLMMALQGLAANVKSLFGVTCTFDCPEPVSISDDLVATHLFRIAQEAVNNAVRHGGARNINIILTGQGGAITLAIRDDGCGMPDGAAGRGSPQASRRGDRAPGLGLGIMQYRANMIGGILKIDSRGGQGTAVVCSLGAGPKN